MKNKTKNFISLFAIYFIVLAVLNVLIFVVFRPGQFTEKECKVDFWFSYSFLTLAFLLQMGTMLLFNKKNVISAVFMGIPLFTLGLIYFFVELFVSLIFMVLAACGVRTPEALVIVFQIVLLAVYLVVGILALLTKNIVEGIDEHQKEKVRNIRNLYSDVELIASMCEDDVAKKLLIQFAEDIRYSDPMSTDLVKDIDNKLLFIVDSLKVSVSEGNYEEMKRLVKVGSFTIKERNNKIANNK